MFASQCNILGVKWSARFPLLVWILSSGPGYKSILILYGFKYKEIKTVSFGDSLANG